MISSSKLLCLVDNPRFSLGDCIVLKQCDSSRSIFGFPFDVYFDSDALHENDHYLVEDLSALTIAKFQHDSFNQPRYLKHKQYSIFVFNNVSELARKTGFFQSKMGLVYHDRDGLCYPITAQLILLLIAVSSHFSKSSKTRAFECLYGGLDSIPLRFESYTPRKIANKVCVAFAKERRLKKLQGQRQPYSKSKNGKKDIYEPQGGGQIAHISEADGEAFTKGISVGSKKAPTNTKTQWGSACKGMGFEPISCGPPTQVVDAGGSFNCANNFQGKKDQSMGFGFK